MPSNTYPRDSKEYVEARLVDRRGKDLSLQTVEMAIRRRGESYVWLPAEWSTEDASVVRTTDPVLFSKAAFPGSTYDVYVRLTDTPEVPITVVGSISISD